MSQLDTTDSSRQSFPGEAFPGESFEENDSDDEVDSILPDNPSNNTNVFKHLVSSTPTRTLSSGSNSVLANCPDITIIKKEKPDNKVNNNTDHSESSIDHHGK